MQGQEPTNQNNQTSQPQQQTTQSQQSNVDHKKDQSYSNDVFKEIEALKKENELYKKKSQELELQRKAKDEEEAKKKGEWETLYKQKTEEFQALQEKNKNLMIMSEVKSRAAIAGLKNNDFIKLFDASELVMDDSGSIVGLDKAIEDFKKKYPEFFKDFVQGDNNKNELNRNTVPQVHNGKPAINRRVDGSTIDQLNAKINDRSTRPSERKRAIAERLKLRQEARRNN